MAYEQQKQRAQEKMAEIFRQKKIGDRPLSYLKRGHKVKWAEPLNPGWFGIPEGNRKYIVEPATMAIDDFLAIQAGTFGLTAADSEFSLGAYNPTVEQAATNVSEIPTPVLEIKADGSIPQEGRSRAMGAKQAGERYMPVWIAVQVYR